MMFLNKNVLRLTEENYTIYWKHYGFMHCIEVKIKPFTLCKCKNICFSFHFIIEYKKIKCKTQFLNF